MRSSERHTTRMRDTHAWLRSPRRRVRSLSASLAATRRGRGYASIGTATTGGNAARQCRGRPPVCHGLILCRGLRAQPTLAGRRAGVHVHIRTAIPRRLGVRAGCVVTRQNGSHDLRRDGARTRPFGPGRSVTVESRESTFPVRVTRAARPLGDARCRVEATIEGGPGGSAAAACTALGAGRLRATQAPARIPRRRPGVAPGLLGTMGSARRQRRSIRGVRLGVVSRRERSNQLGALLRLASLRLIGRDFVFPVASRSGLISLAGPARYSGCGVPRFPEAT